MASGQLTVLWLVSNEHSGLGNSFISCRPISCAAPDCPICHSRLRNSVALIPCGHVFCKGCANLGCRVGFATFRIGVNAFACLCMLFFNSEIRLINMGTGLKDAVKARVAKALLLLPILPC